MAGEPEAWSPCPCPSAMSPPTSLPSCSSHPSNPTLIMVLHLHCAWPGFRLHCSFCLQIWHLTPGFSRISLRVSSDAHICIYRHTCTHVCLHMSLSIHTCTRACLHMSIHTHMYVYICLLHTHMSVCVSLNTHIHTFEFMFISVKHLLFAQYCLVLGKPW